MWNMFKVNNKNARTMPLAVNDASVFIVNFWKYFTPCSSISIVNFEQVNAKRDKIRAFLKSYEDLHHRDWER